MTVEGNTGQISYCCKEGKLCFANLSGLGCRSISICQTFTNLHQNPAQPECDLVEDGPVGAQPEAKLSLVIAVFGGKAEDVSI